MKVTLIYPLLSRERSKTDENKQYWPPLGLAYIAAVLENSGHKVQILDRDYILRKNNFNFERTDAITLKLIKDFDTEIVGFSATTPNISDVNAFSMKIKKADSHIKTVIGGPHCIGEPVLTLELCEAIDMLARGEGEMTMLDIANGLDLNNIGSLTYRAASGNIISSPDRPLIESLDSLPLPARHLLDMDYYTRPSRFISRNLTLRTTHIFTARGCPYNCHYCAGPLMGRRKVRYHSVERVVKEIEDLINKYAVEAVYFAEDMFLSDKKRAIEMADRLIAHNIHKKIVWMAQISTNAADEEFLFRMKEAGCVHVEYGFESGSQRVLELMNKKADVERNEKVAMLTKKAKLRFQGNFIVGYPGEKEEDFNKTVVFIKKTMPNNVSLNLFMPLPGTRIYEKLKEEKRSLPNWDDLGNPEAPYVNYADMPVQQFERLYFEAKLKVVLPINLINFIKDNIYHPIRLFYVASTQFKSVISRLFKAIYVLRKIRRQSRKEARALFVAYQAASDGTMISQGFSYIKNLSKQGVGFSLLTYETKQSLKNSHNYILKSDIPLKWHHLTYHRKFRFLATSFDIAYGVLAAAFIIKRDNIDIVHARGFIPALIVFLPAKIFKAKFLFDTRGLLADKYVGGGLLKKSSFTYKLMRLGERILLKQSDYFTVETHRHAEIIRSSQADISEKLEIIPCCVDTDKFNCRDDREKLDSSFNLVYLGKIGTWYLIDEMLDFFSVISKEISYSHFIFLSPDDPSYLYEVTKNKGIDKSRIIVNKPKPEEIPGLLAKSDAGIFFINPYKRYNSSPIKYGEYLATGLPVVINRGIGDTEYITIKEGIGVVVSDFSSVSYKTACSELISLLKDKDSLRMRCKAAAKRYFSLEEGAQRYSRIYQRLIKK